jgi:hypothetical protein
MGSAEWIAEMSALDELIARDSAPQQSSALDALIAKDAGVTPVSSQVAPAESLGAWSSLGAGLGHGFGSVVLGAQQLLGNGLKLAGADKAGNWLVNDANQGVSNLDSQNSPYSNAHPAINTAGDIGGNLVATAPIALAGAPSKATMLAKALSGARVGAASAALNPVTGNPEDYWGDKGLQVALGGAVGGAAPAVVSTVGNVIKGAGGATQRALADAGVTMTPGQILGGAFKKTEDQVSSWPVVGDFIRNAQRRSINDFNTATYNEVLKPLGTKYMGPVGNDGIAAVKGVISDAYDNALSKMHFDATDPQFVADLGNLKQLATGMPKAQQQTFKNIINTQIDSKLGPIGVMTGEQLKGVQNELGRLAKGYQSDPSFDNRQLGDAIAELKATVQKSLPNYNAPEAVSGLAKADAAYANYVRLRGAGASTGAMNAGGVFTPAQLSAAVRSSDKSVGKGAVATGNALMQDFATGGQEVLGAKYPDSGTAGRALTGIGLGALAGHSLLPPAVLPIAGTVGAGMIAPYTSVGQKLSQALLMGRPAGAQAVGESVNRFLSPISAPLAAALVNTQNR